MGAEKNCFRALIPLWVRNRLSERLVFFYFIYSFLLFLKKKKKNESYKFSIRGQLKILWNNEWLLIDINQIRWSFVRINKSIELIHWKRFRSLQYIIIKEPRRNHSFWKKKSTSIWAWNCSISSNSKMLIYKLLLLSCFLIQFSFGLFFFFFFPFL